MGTHQCIMNEFYLETTSRMEQIDSWTNGQREGGEV